MLCVVVCGVDDDDVFVWLCIGIDDFGVGGGVLCVVGGGCGWVGWCGLSV